MHEFIFNHEAYDVVIEKVVVGYHSLMRFTQLAKNCGVCVEGPCSNVHKTLSSYTLTSIFFVVKYNCVIKLSCLAKSLILEQLLIILYASTTQLGGLCTSCRDLSLSLPIQYLAHTEHMNMPSCWFTHPDACVYVVQMRLYILSTHTHTHTHINLCVFPLYCCKQTYTLLSSSTLYKCSSDL